MIGKLRGMSTKSTKITVILDVGGVGYHVFCSSRTLAALRRIGEAAQLIIDTHVREDHIHLYGFPDTSRARLVSICFPPCSASAIKWRCRSSARIHRSNWRMPFSPKTPRRSAAISGVGPKLAERIVTELKDKVTKLPTVGFGLQDSGFGKKNRIPNPESESSLYRRRHFGPGQSWLFAQRSLWRGAKSQPECGR